MSSHFGPTACLVAAAGLAACAVGPDFKRPETPAPAVYRVPEESPASTEGRALAVSESPTRAPAQHFISGAECDSRFRGVSILYCRFPSQAFHA